MLKKITILTISIFLLIFLLPNFIFAQSSENLKAAIINVMAVINKNRDTIKLKPLKIDNNLCLLAQKIAEDSEKNYPNEFKGTYFSNPEYKKYLEQYSRYEVSKATYNDNLVEKAKTDKQPLTIDQNYLVNMIAKNSLALTSAPLRRDLEYGCIGVSSGNVGYKPFAYFIGGVRKQPEAQSQLQFPLNIFQNIFTKIKSIFAK